MGRGEEITTLSRIRVITRVLFTFFVLTCSRIFPPFLSHQTVPLPFLPYPLDVNFLPTPFCATFDDTAPLTCPVRRFYFILIITDNEDYHFLFTPDYHSAARLPGS